MKNNSYLFALVLLGLIGVTFVGAQTPDGAIKASIVSGDVVSIADKSIVLKTKDSQLVVELTDKTAIKRASPENPSPGAATPAAFSDIGVGDKLVVSGIFGEDKTKLPARTVYIMAKSDIAQKNAKESERWAARGISGKVATVNPQTNQIGIEVRGLMATTTVVLTPKEKAVFKRYAANSVKYSEAVASSLGDIKPGDMLRALGDKSADSLSFAAEEILTGAFQTVAGTVKSVDTVKNEVVITNLQTNKDITVALGTASVMKKFPAEMAQRMVQFQTAGAGTGGPRPAGAAGTGQTGQPAQTGQGQPGGAGRPFGGGAARGGGIDDMLERFPNITAADLKAGDMIAVSSTRNGTADRISAIKLLAGVEPFIRAAQASGDLQRGRGGQGSFTIPGLDGFDGP